MELDTKHRPTLLSVSTSKANEISIYFIRLMTNYNRISIKGGVLIFRELEKSTDPLINKNRSKIEKRKSLREK